MIRFALLCLPLSLALGCSKKVTPKVQLRQTISAIETAVDEKDVDGVMEHVSKQYTDQESQKKSGLRSMLALRFMRQGSIHSLVRIRSMRVQPTTAVADLSVAIAGTPVEEESLLDGLRADIFDLKITFDRVDDEWKVRRAEWDRGGLDLFE